jgi:hypothetical protein
MATLINYRTNEEIREAITVDGAPCYVQDDSAETKTDTWTALYTDGRTHEVEIPAGMSPWIGSAMRKANPTLACLSFGKSRWVGNYTAEHMEAINKHL